MDEPSTKDPSAEQFPPSLQTELERAKSVYETKLLQIQTKLQGFEAKYARVINDLNRFIRGYDERNGTTVFDRGRASDDKNAHIKLASRALVEQGKELEIFRDAYAQAEKALHDMAIEVEKENEGDGTIKKGSSPVRDHGHSKLLQTYESSVEKQQKMLDVLLEMETAFRNSLIDHELEAYCYYEKELADVEAELSRLKEHLEIELRNGEENLARFGIISLLLFILISTSTFYISLNQLVTWAHG